MPLPSVLRRLPLPLLILGGAVLAVVLLVLLKPKPKAPEVREKVWPVAVSQAVPGAHQPQWRLHARVVSPSRAIIKSAISANVRAVPAREGLLLAAGEPLVELDAREAELAVRQREAELAEARAQLERARLDLERSRVALPFAARIAAVAVAPGDRVREGDRLLEVYDPERIELRATLTHEQAQRLRQALEAGAVIGGSVRDGAVETPARLLRLAGETAAGQAGLDAFFAVDAAAALTLGRVLELIVDLPPEAGTVLLPVPALYGADRVYALREGRLRAVPVTVLGERAAEAGQPGLLVLRPQSHPPGTAFVITHLPNAVDGLKASATAAPAP